MPSSPIAGAPPGTSLRDAKLALRARVLAARDALSAFDRSEGSRAIAARLAALPSFIAARCVLLTLPFASEWDTRELAAAALAAGKRVAAPRVDGVQRMLALHLVQDLVRDVRAGWRSIPEPLATQPAIGPEEVDWVLVPGVAFDPRGGRLGYGGGFYDRLLPLVRPAAPRVAGAFDLQVVAAVPAGAHDVPVDLVATPTRIFGAVPRTAARS